MALSGAVDSADRMREEEYEPPCGFSGAGFDQGAVCAGRVLNILMKNTRIRPADQIVPRLRRATVAIINKVQTERRDPRAIAQAENGGDYRNGV